MVVGESGRGLLGDEGGRSWFMRSNGTAHAMASRTIRVIRSWGWGHRSNVTRSTLRAVATVNPPPSPLSRLLYLPAPYVSASSVYQISLSHLLVAHSRHSATTSAIRRTPT